MGHTQGKRALSRLGAEGRAEWAWLGGGSRNSEKEATMVFIF